MIMTLAKMVMSNSGYGGGGGGYIEHQVLGGVGVEQTC